MSEQTVEVKEETPKQTKAVIYTDGGARPSRGFGGWGYHAKVGDMIFDGWGYIPGETTNNVAEITAAVEAIKLADVKEIADLTIRTDSNYVLEGITKNHPTWEANNWMRQDGSEVVNREHWTTLIDVTKGYESKYNPINWEKVEGHSGNEGNDYADRNATKGVMLSINGHQMSFSVATEAKKYGKQKPVPYHRFFCHSYWYFNTRTGTLLANDNRAVYHCGNHEIIGKPEPDAAHSVIILKEPNDALEAIRTHQDRLMGADEQRLFLAHVNNIHSARVLAEINENGTVHMGRRHGARDLKTVDKDIITEEVKPMGLAFNLMREMSFLQGMLERYIAKDYEPDWCLTDITEQLYDQEVKGKGKKERTVYVFSKDITPTTKSIKVNVEHKAKPNGSEEAPITLTFGIDILTRNALSALAKEEPKVRVITWPESNHGFRHAVILETEDDIGIWTSGHANLRVL